ncbi:hypothetical protein RN001_000185 [Aquatica leii]|uniref:Uncharacterized protein n=1 Tax=Aquatica leii TaxID=1421715 RepID=A0AAN7PEL0_9COLE|nr:hypothetical protein RN001_000185 [Aquatica leii]
MIISSTKFKHKKTHKITWIIPGGNSTQGNQIDHVLVAKKNATSIRDVRTFRGASADTDHFLVIAKIKQKFNEQRTKEGKEKRWEIDKFTQEEMKTKYKEATQQELATVEIEEDVDSKCTKMKHCNKPLSYAASG